MDGFIDVTEREFIDFVKTYPKPLEFDVYMVCEPPVATYNDFTLGNWPDSVVARYAIERDKSKTDFKIIAST